MTESLDREQRRSALTGLPIEAYGAVAARRMQWDQLVWQVPVLSLTGQAFLFTIALSAGNSQAARATSSLLALLAALLSMVSMSRHRQAEIADAHWLEDYERANFAKGCVMHGRSWARLRQDTPAHQRGWHRHFAGIQGYDAWMAGFAIFAVAAFVILVLSFASPQTFG